MKFEQVSLQTEKTGKCIVCGKRRKRSKKFWQTINPFNTNADGVVKTRMEIIGELNSEIEAWRKEPINCCE